MPRIKLGEVNINYVEAGEGEAFLFVPGLIGLAKAWEFQFPHFSGRCRSVSFDHRGSGESDKAESGYTTAQIAADAAVPAHRDRNVAANCIKPFLGM